MPADIMKVDDQAKIDLFQEIMPIVMQYLAANSPDQALIADDIIDFSRCRSRRLSRTIRT